MATRDITEETGQIASDSALTSAPVRNALNEIVSWFSTTPGTGIDNGDISTSAAIVSTKLLHGAVAMNKFLSASGEHNAADGTHTQVSQGIQNLVITPNSTYPEYQVGITADFITVENTSGSKHMVGLDVDGAAETISETITLTSPADTMDATDGSQISEAASTTYTIVCLRDLTTGGVYTTKFVFYAGTSLDPAFYSTDLAGFNARVTANYTHAKIVGAAYNDADSNLEIPRPIGGGSFNNPYLPSPVLFATGYYVGTGSAQLLTGLGFKPDYVIVQGHWPQYVPLHAIGALQAAAATYSNSFAGVQMATGITSLDYDGFTVGTAANANGSGLYFFYVALKASRGVGTGFGGYIAA